MESTIREGRHFKTRESKKHMLAEIAEVLGHKTLAMVKRYSHLTEQHTSKVVARMNERFLT